MQSRRGNDSDARLTITQRRNPPAKTTSTNETENSEDSIPFDLIVDILSRVPAKSVARCRCVSRLWYFNLRRTCFTELFLTRSRTRPQLLFAVQKLDKFLFLSAPQPQNPDLNSSSVVCVNRLMHFSFNDFSCKIRGPVHGLIYFIDKHFSKETWEEEILPVICNPTTGQILNLPKVKTNRLGVSIYLVYDPVDQQFKVLAMSWMRYAENRVFDEHQILTLGTREVSWRTIHAPPHSSWDEGVCIDGVLYYQASKDRSWILEMIVCFDVRSETFRFIEIADDSLRVVSRGNLINYNGKLGSIVTDKDGYVDGSNGSSGSIEMWILEDVETQVWSKRTYVLPDMWQDMLGTDYLRFVGVTRTNEIVFSPRERKVCCIFYYNMERNTITKVEIQGMKVFNVYKFLDHVEDLKLMQVFE